MFLVISPPVFTQFLVMFAVIPSHSLQSLLAVLIVRIPIALTFLLYIHELIPSAITHPITSTTGAMIP